ncbi:glycosyltransferase family 1 protein [uncultured Frigoribacterium sp.]|uniref:glycosyltransferase family 4 protein n=1 Tax=uncultured Frigoribacterium sp. TaxID=335377 RepID=UPI0028D82697|nr:glycosyltransferase family 1 protein [uncultured Frigoribacterium sp.]
MPSTTPVLIDATAIPAELGGVGRYLEGLVTGLVDAGADFSLVARPEHASRFRTLAPGRRVLTSPAWTSRTPLRLLWEQLGLPLLARRVGARLVHSPHYTRPLVRRGPRVVTLHDATFFSDPERHGALKRGFFSAWTRLALRDRRTVCVVPSEATASELRRFVRGARAHVVVAHHGVDAALFRPPTAAETEAARPLLDLAPGRPWIAFLGTIEPRKNVGVLIEAHHRLRDADPDFPDLVIAGGRGWDDDALALLDARRPGDGLHEVGYLPLETLPALLGGSEAVVYPSVAEGFGLPVLEAMATGACVLTTRWTAIPEVGGDAVAYTDVSVDALVESLRSLMDDEALRGRLGRAGRARAAEFTWRRTADRHLVAYEEAA